MPNKKKYFAIPKMFDKSYNSEKKNYSLDSLNYQPSIWREMSLDVFCRKLM